MEHLDMESLEMENLDMVSLEMEHLDMGSLEKEHLDMGFLKMKMKMKSLEMGIKGNNKITELRMTL